MASPAALSGTKPPITSKGLIQAAYACGGIVSLVAECFGVSRNAIYRHIRTSKRVEEAFSDASESILDLAESKHIEAIRSGNYQAIMFHLRTRGRKRGYGNSDAQAADRSRGFILQVNEVSTSEDARRTIERIEERLRTDLVSPNRNVSRAHKEIEEVLRAVEKDAGKP